MKKYIILSAICVLSIGIMYSLRSFLVQTSPLVIVQIYEETAVGDKNQIIGVVNALKKHKNDLVVIDFPCNKKTDISNIIKDISDSKQNKIVIGLGKTAFSVFDQLSTKNLPHIKTLILGHQWVTAHHALLGKVTWIAIPDYAMPTNLPNTLSTKLIRTNGVSHAVTHDSLQKEYDSYRTKLSLTADDQVVILGGDAPTTTGLQKRFTEEDASELAIAIAIIRERKNGNFYVVNGPRTGKFNKNLEEIKNIHKDDRIDAVTVAFIETLKKQGISENRIKLYDFKFGQKSLYIPLLAAAFSQDTPVWVPGESSSMICEVISNIAPKNIIIYDNHAMNETHKSHVENVYKQGRARHYSKGAIKNLAAENVVALPDARDQIVQIIIEASRH